MTKKEWMDGYKLVIEAQTVEIPLSDFEEFLVATDDIDDDYEITVEDMQEFMDRNLPEFCAYNLPRNIRLAEK